MISQGDLEAGADGVHEVAEAAGYASWINRDQERGLAAAVIRKVDAHRASRPAAAAPVTVPTPHVEHHAVGFFAGLLEKIKS